MSETCLTFDRLALGYDRRVVLHDLTGELCKGSLTAVVGANGSGKSTLMKAVAGILQPMSGLCRHDASRIAYLPQQAELDRSFPAQVHELVGLGLWPKRGLLGWHTKQDKLAIVRALHAVGMDGLENTPIDALSGGQLQRCLFARVILQDAGLILLDEPFNAVDSATTADLVRLIRHWHAEGRTIMVVVHDIELVRRHFPQTLLLAGQPIAWGETADVLCEKNLRLARQVEMDRVAAAQNAFCASGHYAQAAQS
ncbi:metal ABC transporter ATP-binding protein [Aureimonas fodinaquatilis]|uniref:Metal ABC transporter ATP-binding protein n=1 Tax=Aureimonas fodinaquatilis TaxID=2565783 RepID=A0A5B0DZK4_9HYPH|nr:zinc ABC transporter ATP-binding protein AztA [Aureimonas fodinaquatilis]KAA0970649.1 metal ABC transporter ATP-binding protein [Aureimonas fodinaquatilis]